MNSSKHRGFVTIFAVAMVTCPIHASVINITSGSTSGYMLTDGNTYVVQNSATFSNLTIGGNGMTVASNSTVVIYLPQGVTLTVKGRAGSGRIAGGAGICVPERSTLVVTGEGTISAMGGDAGNGENGENGWGGSMVESSGTSGAGGKGGNGGGGAGAGIGGAGGTGAIGGLGGASVTSEGVPSLMNLCANGTSGTAGNDVLVSIVGEGMMGNVYIIGKVTLAAQGGNAGQAGEPGHVGESQFSYIGQTVSTKYGLFACGGGAGGAGGAGASPSCGIGRGGAPGAGGGGGGSGAVLTVPNIGSGQESNYERTCNAHGGSGGDGGDVMATGGGPGNNGVSVKVNDHLGNTYGTFRGGTGGVGGTCKYGTGQVTGRLYISPTASVSFQGERESFSATTHAAAQYLITFNANGGTFSDSTTTLTATLGCPLPDAIQAPSNGAKEFLGWSPSIRENDLWYDASGSKLMETYAVASNVTLYAVWEADTRLDVVDIETVYDGKPKSVLTEASFQGGATAHLCYALAEWGPYSETNPSFTDAGTNEVWVVATAEGQDPITNSAKVVILPKALDAAMACVVPDQVYDGTPKTPELHIRDGWPDILSPEDYTIRYEDNVEVGTARIVVTGRRNYTGTIELPFGIDAADPERYLVVDLSGGAKATVFPISYLADVPAGGWTDEYKTTKLVLRKVQAGSFWMGRSGDTVGRQVTLTRGFHIGVFEVTQKQWELVMGTNVAKYVDIDHPVEMVSYNMIRGDNAGAAFPTDNGVDETSFIGVLRAKTGLDGFDLPTEAQWEYACRAGTDSAFNSGKDLESEEGFSANLAELGRYNGNRVNESHATVGMYLPNRWGLFDMHGNVYEWCLDWYGGSPGGGTNPEGPSSGANRVSRGGSWHLNASNSTSYNRYYDCSPSLVYNYRGFRLACDGLVTTTWFVDGTNNYDANDGLSWASAFTTIQAAVDTASDGDTILVRPGVYKESNNTNGGLNNNRGIRVSIRSTAGPLVTALDGDGKRRVVKGTGSNTQNAWADHCLVLDGFTIRAGSNSGVGVAAYCVFRNCIFRDNDKGMATAVDIARLENCLVVGNVASNATDATQTKLFDRSEIINCTIVGNRLTDATTGSMFERCSVINSVFCGNNCGNGSLFGNGTTVSFSCSDMEVTGSSNIVANATATLVDAANGDYRLRDGSPCIDAGQTSALDLPFDLAENPRVKGLSIDMGCYEFQTETWTTPVPVPFAWLDGYPTALDAFGGDYETFASANAANGVNKVWECYVAGLCPTNATATFEATIVFTNGNSVVHWTPDLNKNGTKHERIYTVEGKESLSGSWGPTNEATRFFRVKVQMPK